MTVTNFLSAIIPPMTTFFAWHHRDAALCASLGLSISTTYPPLGLSNSTASGLRILGSTY